MMASVATHYAVLEDRGLIRVDGSDARSFLQALVSNDVERVGPERVIYAALLTPQGKFLHDFFVFDLAGALGIDCERARQGDLQRRLLMYKLRAKIDIADLSDELAVAVAFGPEALARLGLPDEAGRARTLPAIPGAFAYVDPRLPALGARLVLPGRDAHRLADLGLLAGDADHYDQWRLGHGVPDGSRDLEVERAILLEYNLDALHGIDFAKGCYVGQELTARTKYRGLIRKKLFRVDADGPIPPPDTPVMLGDQEAGVMRSGRGAIGLALLRLDQVAAAHDRGQPLTAAGRRLTPVKPAWGDF